jgi:hypothetical protein
MDSRWARRFFKECEKRHTRRPIGCGTGRLDCRGDLPLSYVYPVRTLEGCHAESRFPTVANSRRTTFSRIYPSTWPRGAEGRNIMIIGATMF